MTRIYLTFFNSDKPILFPDITYSFYPVWANVYRIPYECPKLTDDFRICPDDYKKENGGVVIANPNAPTSLALSRDEIEEIIAANQDAIVIVDEAYIYWQKCVRTTSRFSYFGRSESALSPP